MELGFFFRADVILREIAAHLPDPRAGLTRSPPTWAFRRRATALSDAAERPIDVGVMEKLHASPSCRETSGWSDVGSFATAWELAAKDAAGNPSTSSRTVLVDAKDCFVRSPPGKDRRPASRTSSSSTPATRCCDAPRDRAQDVKKRSTRTARGLTEKPRSGSL